jgi:hypothetical protein
MQLLSNSSSQILLRGLGRFWFWRTKSVRSSDWCGNNAILGMFCPSPWCEVVLVALHWFYGKYVTARDSHISVARHSVPLTFWSKFHCFIVSCINLIFFLLLNFFFTTLLYSVSLPAHPIHWKASCKIHSYNNRRKHRHKWTISYREEFLGYICTSHSVTRCEHSVPFRTVLLYIWCVHSVSHWHMQFPTHHSLSYTPLSLALPLTGNLTRSLSLKLWDSQSLPL